MCEPFNIYNKVYFCCRVQSQVNEVIDVMRDNIGKVLDRGEKLSELEVKSGLSGFSK